jgi:proteasome lid subunit RPN8/RPN11
MLQIGILNYHQTTSAIMQQIELLPVISLLARNYPTWEVRLRYGLEQEMKKLLLQAKPNETGGLLIGMVNLKRRIIYITRILPAPPDSKGSPYAFVRGVRDIPERVVEIQNRSGGMLGYVGEWHTHPRGGAYLSAKDMDTVEKIRATLTGVQLPTHVLIVTSRGLYPYVFDPL